MMNTRMLPFLKTDRVYFPNNSASILVTTPEDVNTIELLISESQHDANVYVAVFTKIPKSTRSLTDCVDIESDFVNRFGVIVLVTDMKRLLSVGRHQSMSYSVAVQVTARCNLIEYVPEKSGGYPCCVVNSRESITAGLHSEQAAENFTKLKVIARKLLPSLRSARAVALTTYLRSHHVLPDVLTDVVAAICSRGDLGLKLRILKEESVSVRLALVLELAEQQLAQVGSSWDGGSSAPYLIAVIDKGAGNKGAEHGSFSSLTSPSEDQDLVDFRKALSNPYIPPRVRSLCEKEVLRLGRMSTSSPDYSMTRLYVETLLDIPWGKEIHTTKFGNDGRGGYAASIDAAKSVLDAHHCGMALVKKRILEFIAVQCLEAHAAASAVAAEHKDINRQEEQQISRPPIWRKSPTILCLVGPPGVGKTSLGNSISRALGRKFERIALGGVNNEATLRGHRRTYVGAIPGRIVQALRSAECMNPVILLDEVDKVGTNTLGGDPAAALLEILDPNQNHAFVDHFIGQPIDLSKVIFIATANRAEHISSPLLDRMELLTLSGYSLQEKQHIASLYLLPKQTEGSFLELGKDIQVLPSAIVEVICGYTREAGVRQLEMRIGAICRHVAMKKAHALSGGDLEEPNGHDFTTPVVVTADEVAGILGPKPYHSDAALEEALPGVATGMAWTSTGGELLFIESSCYFKTGSGPVPHAGSDNLAHTRAEGADSGSILPSNRGDGTIGSIHVTGSLGEVMKESCHIALSWLRSNSAMILSKAADWKEKFSPQATVDVVSYLHDVEAKILNSCVHVHIPCGSVSKDGPSAGCAILVSLVSMVTGIMVDPQTAITGELTLRGAILPVGGIREKLLAAQRGGIKRVLMPLRNISELTEETKALIEGLVIIPIKKIEDVLNYSVFSSDVAVESAAVKARSLRCRL